MTVLDKDGVIAMATALQEGTSQEQSAAAEVGGLQMAVISLRASQDGERIGVSLELCDTARGLRERQLLAVSTELFADLGIAKGSISPNAYDALLHASQLTEAMRRAVSMLGYGANSARSLEQKLRARGFTARVATQAVARLADKGYLREASDACRVAQRSLDKGWGMRRILDDLRHRGYDADAVEQAREVLSEEDFYERCACAARKKSPVPPTDIQEKRKLTDFLMRYGYGGDQIRYALQHAWQTE